jgi:hypothetical protein
MRASLERRVSSMERVLAARRRTHYLFKGLNETEEALQARKRAMIGSGEAGPNDLFVVFRWRSPAGEGG